MLEEKEATPSPWNDAIVIHEEDRRVWYEDSQASRFSLHS